MDRADLEPQPEDSQTLLMNVRRERPPTPIYHSIPANAQIEIIKNPDPREFRPEAPFEMPGEGIVEESPNLSQLKGQNFGLLLTALLEQAGISAPVHLLNDADAMAAGIAAARGQLDRVVRVWFLGSGIGYGRYPQAGMIGEGGHTIVTLDPKEKFCQCGGVGHLEGIMGYRAMRRRFLDMEPEEVFAEAKAGDGRCVAFVELWHRALAAATATSIHYEGPGKFYISGPDSRFVQTEMLQIYLRDMVKMSSLQGSAIEVIPTSDEIAIVGAAVSAAQAACGRA